MPHNPNSRKLALTRIRPIRGQIIALEQALEEGMDCTSILHRLAAVRGAVNGLMTAVLGSYLREEFSLSESWSDSQKQAIDETISIVRSYLR